MIKRIATFLQSLQEKVLYLDFLGPLLLRIYLVPIFWTFGNKKWDGFENTAAWFGNPDWGLGLPFPTLLAFLATWTEILGAVLLTIGLGVRLITIPLMVTMIVAAVTAHLDYGWQAISDAEAPFANERVEEAVAKKEKAIEILKEHGNYEWLTASGSFTILNNGIEFAATYFIMLLVVFFTGGGRFISIDDWLKRYLVSQKIIN